MGLDVSSFLDGPKSTQRRAAASLCCRKTRRVAGRTGMPLHLDTMSATSVSVTSSRSIRTPSACATQTEASAA